MNDKWIVGSCDFCSTENIRVLVLWEDQPRLYQGEAWDNRKPADNFRTHLCVFCCELPETGALTAKRGVSCYPNASLLSSMVKIAHVLLREMSD